MKAIAILIVLLSSLSAFSQEFIPIQDQLLSQLNDARKRKGKKEVVYNTKYQSQCDRWAKRISTALYHNYKDYFHGEVISQVIASEELIIPLFLTSKTHKDVLLDRKIKSVCMAVYTVPAKTIVHKDGVEYVPKSYYTVIRTYY